MIFHTSSGFSDSNNRGCQSFFKLNSGNYITENIMNSRKNVRLVIIFSVIAIVEF